MNALLAYASSCACAEFGSVHLEQEGQECETPQQQAIYHPGALASLDWRNDMLCD